MDMTLTDYMNMGLNGIADSPGEIIKIINDLGKNSTAQIKCINKIVTWLHKHASDTTKSNDMIGEFTNNWFADHDIHTIKEALKSASDSKKSQWDHKTTIQALKYLQSRHYKFVCGVYTIDSSINDPAPVGYKMITRFLWDLNEKQEAHNELADL